MVFGYARVSAMEQSLDLQLDAMLKRRDSTKEHLYRQGIYTLHQAN